MTGAARGEPTLKSVLVSVTEGCHVGCAHCGFIGSKRDRESDPAELTEWVRQICDHGLDTVIFTGGEPFERFDVLAAGVASSTAAGVPAAVFTSSYWATTLPETRSLLAELDGLEHLYLSSDVYHQRNVPYQNVWNVIEASQDLGIPKVSIVITYARTEDLLEVRSHYEQYADAVRFVEERVIPTPYIQRALRDQDDLLPAEPANYPDHCWLDTPIVNPNGDVFACHIGKAGAHENLEDLPYWLGNLRRSGFAEIMADARRRSDYQYLRTHGPKGVVTLFTLYPEIAEECGRTAFTGECDMCFSALSQAAGRNALHDHVRKPEVLTAINVRLALLFGERPIEQHEVTIGAGDRRALALPVVR